MSQRNAIGLLDQARSVDKKCNSGVKVAMSKFFKEESLSKGNSVTEEE